MLQKRNEVIPPLPCECSALVELGASKVRLRLACCQVQISVASPRGDREVKVANEASLVFGSGEVGSMVGLPHPFLPFPKKITRISR